VAAAESVPARLRPGQGKGRLGKQLQLRGKVDARLVWGCSRPGAELTAAASNGAGGCSGRGRRAQEELAWWRILYSGSTPLAAQSGEGRTGHGQCLGRRVGITDGQTDRKGPAVRPVPVRPRGVRRRGGNFETALGRAWLRERTSGRREGARTLRRAGAGARDAARRRALAPKNFQCAPV
jgi:hypothetical protein